MTLGSYRSFPHRSDSATTQLHRRCLFNLEITRGHRGHRCESLTTLADDLDQRHTVNRDRMTFLGSDPSCVPLLLKPPHGRSSRLTSPQLNRQSKAASYSPSNPHGPSKLSTSLRARSHSNDLFPRPCLFTLCLFTKAGNFPDMSS